MIASLRAATDADAYDSLPAIRGSSLRSKIGGNQMRCIRLAILLASTMFAALLLAPSAWAAVAPVTFTGPTDLPVGANPNSVATGDFNGDGDPDLAVAN